MNDSQLDSNYEVSGQKAGSPSITDPLQGLISAQSHEGQLISEVVNTTSGDPSQFDLFTSPVSLTRKNSGSSWSPPKTSVDASHFDKSIINPADSSLEQPVSSPPRKKRKHKSKKRSTHSPSPLKNSDSKFNLTKDVPSAGSVSSCSKKSVSEDKEKSIPNFVKNDQCSSKSFTDERKSGRCRRRNTFNLVASEPSDSTSLVAYNSSGDEFSSVVDRLHRSHSDTNAQTHNVLNLCSVPSKPTSDTATDILISKSTDVKVVKTTAKSTWDSSDSDFDPTELRRAPKLVPHVEPAELPITSPSFKEKPKPPSRHSRSKHRGLRHADEKCHPDRHSSHTDRDGTQESIRSFSGKRGRTKRRKRKRSRSRRTSSASSASSGSRTLADKADNRRKRSYSRRRSAPSSHDSEYSTSSHSSGWRSHRRSHRRRSKSYTSSAPSSENSHRYRSRSSRRDRRRHRRRSYRHRYRRRSYSSRSRSRSWRTSDESSSYRSSRSLSRRSSGVSRHRSSTTYRSPSHASAGRRKVSSRLVDPVRDSSDTQQSKFTLRSLNDSTSSNKNYDNLQAAFSMSSVAETVSAAVKRVTSGNLSIKPTKSCESSSLRLPTDSDHSVPVTNTHSGSSVLVDIPLPKDVSRTDHETEHKSRTDHAPYIGPQLPPDLAKRFGLVMGDPSADESCPPTPATSTACAIGEADSTNSSSENTLTAPSNSLEYLIPPEKVEQYRVLQEQAKQHALRRNNLLSGADTSESATSGSSAHVTDIGTHAQQLALLQHQLNLLSSTGFVYPAYSANATLLPAYVNTTSAAHHTVPTENVTQHQLAQMSEEARMRTLSALLGAQQQQLTAMAATVPKTSTSDISAFSTLLPTVLQQQQQLQQNQVQQLISAVAGMQSSQSSATCSAVAQPQAALTAHFLQQLVNQHSNKLTGGAVAASTLAALLQQQKLQTQLQKQSTDVLQRGVTSADNVSSMAFLNDLASTTSNALVVNPAVWSTALARARGVNPSMHVFQPQAIPLSAALLAAAAQQQQQQLLASALRQSVIQQSALPQEVAWPLQLTSAGNRLLSPQQQQQLLYLQVLQQKQQQQQPRLMASTPSEQSLIQVQLAAALQQQRQQQLVQVHLQHQQQQQQALAASAALAAAQSQRQQSSQDPSGKS